MLSMLTSDTITLAIVTAGFVIVWVATLFIALWCQAERRRMPAVVRSESLGITLAARESRLGELNEQIREREATLAVRDAVEAEAQHWQAMLDSLKAEYAALGEQRAEIETVREDYRKAVEQLGAIETELRQRRAEEQEARQSLREAVERLKEIEKDVERLNERRAELGEVEQQLAAKRQELEPLRLEYAELVARRYAVELELQRARQEIEALAARQAEAEELRRRLEALRPEHDQAVAKKEAQLAQIAELEEEANRLEARMARLTEQTASLAARQTGIDDLRRMQESLRQEQGRLVAKREAEQARLDGMAAENARLEARVARLREQSGSGGTQQDMLQDLLSAPECLRDQRLAAAAPAGQVPQGAEMAALAGVKDRLRDAGLKIGDRTLYAFHTSLKTAVISPLTVLAGISGTGKSQLPRFYAEAIGMHFLKIPVQPRWDSPQDLLGFYNYIEQGYRATELARALVHLDPLNWQQEAASFADRMLLVLLDEMNLARVEYYFAEFLSRLEGRPMSASQLTSAQRLACEIEIDIPRLQAEDAEGQERRYRVYPDQNVLFVGTMNEDESTLALSDKVVDRANVLRFPKPSDLQVRLPQDAGGTSPGYLPRARWGGWIKRFEELDSVTRERVAGQVKDLNDVLGKAGRPFGHRLNQAILHYVANYPSAHAMGGNPVRAALSDQIQQRILPKLRGLDVETFRGPLHDLAAFCRDEIHDDSLAEAIETATTQAGHAGGLFVWRGLTAEA